MRRGRRLTIGAAACAAGIAPVGCGEADHTKPAARDRTKPAVGDRTTPAASTGDRRIASAGLLRLEDFPPGWRAGPSRSRNNNRCPQYLAVRRAARVRQVSEQFAKDEASVFDSVAVLGSPSQARRGIRGLASQSFVDCLRRAIETQIAPKVPGGRVTDLHAGRLSVRGFGDETAALEVTGTVEGDQGGSVDFFADAYIVRQGRTIAFFTFLDLFSPVDQALRDRLTQEAVDRLGSVEQ